MEDAPGGKIRGPKLSALLHAGLGFAGGRVGETLAGQAWLHTTSRTGFGPWSEESTNLRKQLPRTCQHDAIYAMHGPEPECHAWMVVHTVMVRMITGISIIILASPSLSSVKAVWHPNLLVAYSVPISINCRVNEKPERPESNVELGPEKRGCKQ